MRGGCRRRIDRRRRSGRRRVRRGVARTDGRRHGYCRGGRCSGGRSGHRSLLHCVRRCRRSGRNCVRAYRRRRGVRRGGVGGNRTSRGQRLLRRLVQHRHVFTGRFEAFAARNNLALRRHDDVAGKAVDLELLDEILVHPVFHLDLHRHVIRMHGRAESRLVEDALFHFHARRAPGAPKVYEHKAVGLRGELPARCEIGLPADRILRRGRRGPDAEGECKRDHRAAEHVHRPLPGKKRRSLGGQLRSLYRPNGGAKFC